MDKVTHFVHQLREKLRHRERARFIPTRTPKPFVFETLEPRLLMSADPLGAGIAVEPIVIAPAERAVISAVLLENSSSVNRVAQGEPSRTGSVAAERRPERQEIVFVDTRVNGYESFIKDLSLQTSSARRIDIRILDPERDGIEQISESLAAYSDLAAVHFISHGTDGAVQLGATWLDRDSLQETAGSVAKWSSSLSADADLLFYGCDLAASADGVAFIEQLSLLTGADVAASVDNTGHTQLGGDWQLEYVTGQIETAVAVSSGIQAEWINLLATHESFTNYTSELEIKSDANHGQTFQHNSGSGSYSVDEVSLALRKDPAASAQLLTVTLRNSWNGTILGSATISSSSLGTSLAWHDLNVGNVTLNDNQSYTIRVTSNTTNGNVYTGFNPSGGYTGGTRLDVSGAPLSGEDVAFKVGFTGTNTAPTATNLNAAESYTEDTPRNLTNIVISDSDSANVTATLTLSTTAAGSLSTGISGAVTSTYNVGTGVWSASGAISDVNTLLAGLTFTPELNYNSNFTIATSVDDGVAAAITGVKNVTGVVVNDTPTASNMNAAETYTLNTPLNLADVIVSDVDSLNVTARLTLSDPGAGSLNTATSGLVTSTYNPGTGQWTAGGSIADVNALLADLTYTPNLLYLLPFTIDTGVDDGLAPAITGVKNMTVGLINLPPFATNVNAAETYNEDTPLDLTDIVVSDVDSANVTVTLTLSDSAAGSLSIASSGSVTSTFNVATGVWSASGAKADVNALLANVTFAPSANYNSNFTIATSISDGVAPAITGTKAMTGAAVNDAPLATNLNAGENYTEDTPLNLTDIVVSDVDSSNITVTLTLSDAAAGSLNAGTSGSVTSTYNSVSGVWTTSGAIFDVNTLLTGLTFTPALNYTSNFIIATSVDDGVASAITGTKNMIGTAVNDAPVNSVPGLQSTAQDTSLIFDASNGNRISISDIDASSSQIEVTLTVTNGTVTLNWPSGTANVNGGEFRVNTATSDRQATLDGEFYGGTTNDFGGPRAVASDPSGNFVVIWSSKNQDGDGWGIYAQRYNSVGIAQGGAFRVNTTTADDEVHASIAMDDAGNFVIVWAAEVDGNNWGIYAQRYNSAGVIQGTEIHVNTYTNKEQLGPTIAMDSSGDFVIAWSSKDQDGDNWGVYAKRFSANGVVQGGEFRVNTSATKEQTAASVAMDDHGDFVIAWSSKDQDGDNWGVYAKRFNAEGLVQGSEFRVNTLTAKDQMFSSVAMDADGNFVVTWSSKDEDGDNWGVYAQRYDALGIAQGAAFRANQITAKEQMHSSVSMDVDGDFVITWSSKDQDGGGWGIYARQFDLAGTAKTGETRVNSTTSGDQEYSSAAMDAQGNFVVAWSGSGPGDSQGVFAQRFTIASPLTFAAGDGTRDAVMTVRGTEAQINSVLDGLVFMPNSGFNGMASITVATNDLGNSGSGGAQSDSDAININVGGSNVAPTLTLAGGALDYIENDSATVIDSGATLVDPDSADFDGGQFTVFFSAGGTDNDQLAIRNQGTAAGEIGVTGSSLTYNYGAGAVVIGTFTGGTDGVTPLVMTLNASATTAAVQALARNITYQNLSDNPSTLERIAQFGLTDGDGGTSADASRSIDLAAVNDAPAANNLNVAETYTEDTPLDLTDIVVSDLDSTDVTVTLTLSTAAAGILSIATAGTVSSTYNSATGVWTASGAVADVNTLLAGLTFTPALNYDSNFTIATSVDDGVAPAITGTKTMTGTAVNDAPVLVNNALTISEGGSVVLSGNEISATDVDNAGASLPFTTSAVSGGQFELVSNPGVAITSFTQGQVTAGGAIRFVHGGGEAAPSYNVTVSDGSLSDGPAAATITFTNHNDAPIATNLNAAETYTEDTLINLIDIVVSDADSANVTVTMTLSDAGAGSLSTATSGSVTSSYNAATGVWSASGAIADVNTLLTSLTFTPALNYASNFTISTSVDDGAGGRTGGVKAMTGTAVNDAPLATNLNAAQTYTEDTSLVLTDIVVSDLDSTNVTVTLSLSDVAAGSLNTAISGLVTSTYNAGTGVWTASGAVVDVNTLLAALTFTPAPNCNGNFTIATNVNDGVEPALTGTKNMTGTAVNDAPAASNLNAAETYTEDTPLDLTDIVVSDVDSANVTVTLTLSDSAAGSLNIATSGSVTSTYNAGMGVWIASGAIADVNTLLAGLTFTPALNYNSNFTIAARMDDGVAPAITGVKNMTGTVVEDAPVLVNNTLTISEGGSVVLSGGELSATDVDNAGASLMFMVADVSGGQFELAASPAIAVTSFTQGQISGGAVRFVHDGGEAAPSYVVTVSDGSLSNGPAAPTINFTHINDAPALANNQLTISQGSSVALSSSNISAIDVDDGVASLSFTVSNVSGGHFELAASPGIVITSFTQAELGNGVVRFMHDGGAAAPHYDVTVSDGQLSDGPAAATITFNRSDENIEPVTSPPTVGPLASPVPIEHPDGAPIEAPAENRNFTPVASSNGGPDATPSSAMPEDFANEVEAPADAQSTRDAGTGSATPSRILPKQSNENREARNEALLLTPNTELENPATGKLTSGDLSSVIEANGLVQGLDKLRDEVREESYLEKLIVGSSLTATTGFSIGYVLWLVRGEVLLTSLLASLPAWRLIDPLPVLSFLNKRPENSEEDEEDDDSLQATVAKGGETPQLAPVQRQTGGFRPVKWRIVTRPADSMFENHL